MPTMQNARSKMIIRLIARVALGQREDLKSIAAAFGRIFDKDIASKPVNESLFPSEIFCAICFAQACAVFPIDRLVTSVSSNKKA